MKLLKLLLILVLALTHSFVFCQTATLQGVVASTGKPIEYATVAIPKLNMGATTDSAGVYHLKKIPAGTHQVRVHCLGYFAYTTTIQVKSTGIITLNIELEETNQQINEVVVTGTLKEVSRSESAVPVEIITPKLFKKNPTPSLFEAVGMLNGVQPQLNCNVCNTGDIHINGMEGPYTMILIDGMPIVSALSTVYGLSGIPNSLVERIEVVKGPASSLYGSEAMGGIINVITKNPNRAPLVSADVFGTSWGEYSVDAAVKFTKNKKTSLLGVNYYNYQNPIDKNGDGFTDVTLQNRISVFNKWNFERKDHREASIAGRYVYEDRWGGQMNWNEKWRGSDTIYGESIYTNRAEMIGKYQFPMKEKIYTQFSYNWHRQNSYYGIVPYMATQQVAFVQTYWDKALPKGHTLLVGASYRYTYYDDNTPATTAANGVTNQPARTPLPGIFVQDEWTITPKHKLLVGYRYDYDKHHGNVHSPRLAYKFSPNVLNTLRASFGSGYRVVNLFTEDHAALTGARKVIIAEALNPERSYNSNLNYETKLKTGKTFIGFDATGFYSYFTNKIVGDFDTDPNKIIYNNLKGYAVSRGVSVNADITFKIPLKLLAGITYMDVFQMNDNGHGLQRKQQLHASKWSGNFVISYQLPKNFTVDFTGKWYGPMRLPILPNDYRPEYSPWFCIANVQFTKKFTKGIEVYGGIKNIFDFIPANPIMRPFDPFDKTASDPVNNPNGYTFDPSYNYSSMQGARGFFGIRYTLLKG